MRGTCMRSSGSELVRPCGIICPQTCCGYCSCCSVFAPFDSKPHLLLLPASSCSCCSAPVSLVLDWLVLKKGCLLGHQGAVLSLLQHPTLCLGRGFCMAAAQHLAQVSTSGCAPPGAGAVCRRCVQALWSTVCVCGRGCAPAATTLRHMANLRDVSSFTS